MDVEDRNTTAKEIVIVGDGEKAEIVKWLKTYTVSTLWIAVMFTIAFIIWILERF